MTTTPTSRPGVALEGYRYNDDLLLDDAKRRLAEQEFAAVFHVVDHEQLRLAFTSRDRAANSAKRRSQVSGKWAVLLATVSLMGGSSEPLWRELPSHWPMVVATASAGCGLLAALLAAFGVMHGHAKEQWTRARLCTERFRQFHFQEFIWNLPSIAQSLTGRHEDQDAYRVYRQSAFAAFEDVLTHQAEVQLDAVLAPTGGSEIWLHDAAQAPVVPLNVDLKPLFKAYRRLRFDEQLRFAEEKIRKGEMTLAFWKAPLRQRLDGLRSVWRTAFGSLLLLHVFIIAGYYYHLSAAHGPVVHVLVIWLALIALATRTLEEGLGLSHELERYEDYHAMVFDARRRFIDARTDEERVQAMIDMERISFEEMRSFLRMIKDSSFVM